MNSCWHHQDQDESKEFLNVNYSRQDKRQHKDQPVVGRTISKWLKGLHPDPGACQSGSGGHSDEQSRNT